MFLTRYLLFNPFGFFEGSMAVIIPVTINIINAKTIIAAPIKKAQTIKSSNKANIAPVSVNIIIVPFRLNQESEK